MAKKLGKDFKIYVSNGLRWHRIGSVEPQQRWPTYYILDDQRRAVPTDSKTWSRRFTETDRRVAFTEIAPGITVSTVFLGLDHNYSSAGPPLLFETMSFDDYGGSEPRRYATWSEAVCGHIDLVEELRAKFVQHQER